MTLIQVAASGTVGKHVYTSSQKVVLKSVLLTPSAANAYIKIYDNKNASGEVVLFMRATSAQGRSMAFTLGEDGHKFTKGMHVTVVGTAAVAYLDIS